MDFDTKKQVIILTNMHEYAVALSALSHGLRVLRINPEIQESLGADTIMHARETRNDMLHQPRPELPYNMPIDAARTAVAGIKSVRYRSTNMPESAISRVRRHTIGELLLKTYQEYEAKGSEP